MKKIKLNIATITLFALFFSGLTYADSATIDLTRTSTLTNVDDAEGRWQYDGGEVRFLKKLVGYYTRQKRVSFGVPASVNAASVSITVFLTGSSTPPQNVTLQGAHDFSSGNEIGGVSATSSDYSFLRGASFSGSSSSIELTW